MPHRKSLKELRGPATCIAWGDFRGRSCRLKVYKGPCTPSWPFLLCPFQILFFFFIIFLKLGIFLVYIFNAIPKVPHPQPPIPYPPTPPFWPWRSPVLGHIKFASPMGLSLRWWPTRPSFDTYAAKDKSSGVLVSSYCCSTYRVAVPYSSLGNFSSSSIGAVWPIQ